MYELPINLKIFRIKSGLTQSQIAEKLGMTYQEYQKIENGKTIIRADKLCHICETLNISADWLLGLNVKNQDAHSFIKIVTPNYDAKLGETIDENKE